MKNTLTLIDFLKIIWNSKYIFTLIFLVLCITQVIYVFTGKKTLSLNYSYNKEVSPEFIPSTKSQELFTHFIKKSFIKNNISIPSSVKWANTRGFKMFSDYQNSNYKIQLSEVILIDFHSNKADLKKDMIKIVKNINEFTEIYKSVIQESMKLSLEHSKNKYQFINTFDPEKRTNAVSDAIEQLAGIKLAVEEFNGKNKIEFSYLNLKSKLSITEMFKNILGSFLLALILTFGIYYFKKFDFKSPK